jgi:hypothetical protein
MNRRIESPDILRRLEADRTTRLRIGEQAFQVEHYLAYWRCYPTRANFLRVLDAVEAYDDGTKKSRYFIVHNSGGRPGSDRRALARVARRGARGKVYTQSFRTGSRTWTKAR